MTAAALVSDLPQWLLLFAAAAAAWLFRRGGGGSAIELLQRANQVLEKTVQDQLARIETLEVQGREDIKLIGELRARTDVSVQIGPILKWTEHHEHRDQERFESTLLVLERIAERLGGDPEGGPS